jgi:hypothetical protein
MILDYIFLSCRLQRDCLGCATITFALHRSARNLECGVNLIEELERAMTTEFSGTISTLVVSFALIPLKWVQAFPQSHCRDTGI